ncbi:MAG: energy transducer TonB [Deltaproteobacteria bacterium]|nr:energy transducer TonB [Deltaproteobacteria bacterium]
MDVIRSALRFLATGLCGAMTLSVVFIGLSEMTHSGDEIALPTIGASKINFTRLRHDTPTQPKPPREKAEPPEREMLPPPITIETTPCGDCAGEIKLMPAIQPTRPPGAGTRPDFMVGGRNDVDIQPIVRVLPDYPPNGRGDGWVLVQFDITKVGSVANARVVDASPRGVFEKNALKAIERWRYRPAVMDGRAVERRGLRVRLSFVLEKA